MKIIIIAITLASVAYSACNNSNNNTPPANTESDTNSTSTATNAPNSKSTGSPIQGIVSNYLELKNALTNDNSKAAASAGKEIVDAIAKIENSSFTENQKKTLEEVREDAKEHAEHISSNAENIKHQREHFEVLSKDIYDLVKAFPTDRTLYHDFCPMYNNNKGGYWISETKEIKNPYLGKEMPTCGEIKEEIK